MRLENNPFYVLGVNPLDTADNITSSAEDKKFDDDENESVYEEARSVLLSPVKRLEAEIRYPLEYTYDEVFDGRRLNDVVEQIKRGNTYCDLTFDYEISNIIIDTVQLYYETEKNMAYVIEHLDYSYTAALKDDEIEMAIDSLNESRNIGGFTECDRDSFVAAIKSLRGDIRVGLNDMFKRFDENQIVEIANDVAEYLINQSEEYGEVVELFISEYSVFISDTLASKKDEVLELLGQARDYTEVYQLDAIDKATRDFDHVAQPIQLLLRDRGQSALQEESIEVAEAIKELLLHYFSDSQRPLLAMHLLDLELELFSELTEFYEQLKKEKGALQAASEMEKVQKEYFYCRDYIENNIKRVEGWENSNAQALRKIMPRMRNAIRNMDTRLRAAQEDGYMSSVDVDRIMIVAYDGLGAACTWGGLWDETIEFSEMALLYASELNEPRVINSISAHLENARQSKYYRSQQQIQRQQQIQDDGDHRVSGAIIGGAIGAAVGGPVGALVGGVIGRWIGKK